MAIAGVLEIQMLANMARLSNDMAQAKSMVGGAMQSIEKSVSVAKAALGALGVGVSVGYFVSLIKGSIDASDHLNDLSKTTSIIVETLAGLKLASKQSGGDLDSVAASISKLSVNMGKDAEKFKALGVSAKDPLQAFKQLSDIFVQIQDPQQRAAVMAAALGKSWAGAAPLLAEGSAKIQEMVDKGTRLSGMTKETAERADEFNDKMAELNTTLESTKTKLVGDLLPGMNDISKAMQEAAKEGGPLLTLWVGLGGAMAYLLNLTDSQKIKTRLVEINEQLAITSKQLSTGTLNPKGANSRFFSFLVPDIKLGEDALSKVRATVSALEKEREKLSPKPTEAAKPADPKAAAAAAAAARIFLDGQEAGKKSAAEAAKERSRLLEQDRKSWVDLAEFKIKEYEEELSALNKLDEERNAYTEKMRAIDLQGWVAMAEAMVNADFEATKQLADMQGAAADADKKLMEDYKKTLHDDVKGALSQAFRDTKDPIKAFGDALGNVIFTRVTNSLADAMATQILTSSVGTGIASLFGMSSFDGGGFTGSGSRSGGVDGKGGFPALLHPNESVVDHTKGQQTGNVTVIQNFTVGDVASISMVRQAVAGSEKRIAGAMGRSMQYGGALS